SSMYYTLSLHDALPISVKIVGDPTNTDYFKDGAVGDDGLTIYLGSVLPKNNLNVVVVYQPVANQNDKLNKQVIRLNRKLPKQNRSEERRVGNESRTRRK